MSFNNRSLIKGKYFPPGDKSISHRILILAGQVVGRIDEIQPVRKIISECAAECIQILEELSNKYSNK